MRRGQEAERLVRRDPARRDEASERKVPPDVGVAERLDGEDQHDDCPGREPCDPARHGVSLLRGVGDDEQVRPFHWFCAPTFDADFACSAHTLPGAQFGTGGRCRVDSLSVGTNATLSPSWYTLVQSAAWSITSASGVLTSYSTMSVPKRRMIESQLGVTLST